MTIFGGDGKNFGLPSKYMLTISKMHEKTIWHVCMGNGNAIALFVLRLSVSPTPFALCKFEELEQIIAKFVKDKAI